MNKLPPMDEYPINQNDTVNDSNSYLSQAVELYKKFKSDEYDELEKSQFEKDAYYQLVNASRLSNRVAQLYFAKFYLDNRHTILLDSKEDALGMIRYVISNTDKEIYRFWAMQLLEEYDENDPVRQLKQNYSSIKTIDTEALYQLSLRLPVKYIESDVARMGFEVNQELARRGNKHGLYQLGWYYQNGYGTEKNYSKALESYRACLIIEKQLGDEYNIQDLENKIALCEMLLGNKNQKPSITQSNVNEQVTKNPYGLLKGIIFSLIIFGIYYFFIRQN